MDKETGENYGKFKTPNGISPQRNKAIRILEHLEGILGIDIYGQRWYQCEDKITQIIEEGDANVPN